MALDALTELPPNTVGEGGHVFIRLHEAGKPVYIGKARSHRDAENGYASEEFAVFGCQDGGAVGVVTIPVALLNKKRADVPEAYREAFDIIPDQLRTRAQTFVSMLPDVNFLYHPKANALTWPYTGPKEPPGEVVASPMGKNAFFDTSQNRGIMTTVYGLKGAAPVFQKNGASLPGRPGVIEPLGVKFALEVS